MEITFLEEDLELQNHSLHVYKWFCKRDCYKSIYILVHGLMMNGKSFDNLARKLASSGSYVFAFDIRGFGRSYFDQEKNNPGMDYRKSLEDISNLVKSIKSTYPDTPVICLGESLGAHFARSVATKNPGLIKALILSSPCLRPRMVSPSLIPHALNELVKVGMNPGKEVDLKPFAEKFLKSEPENLNNYLEDSLSRKTLEVKEILSSVQVVRSLRLRAVSSDIPILVFRGNRDCVCKLKSMEKFLDSLKSNNISFHKLEKYGHLIMQSPKVSEEIIDVISAWCQSKVIVES